MSALLTLIPAIAALQFVPATTPQAVFTGESRAITSTWRNTGDETTRTEISARILQAASTTAAPVGDIDWKELQILPGQTVVETTALAFPLVKSPTHFVVQWVADRRTVLGATEVVAYPPDLLHELQTLAAPRNDDDAGLLVLDPEARLKPALRAGKIAFTDLEEIDDGETSGRLALIATNGAEYQKVRALAKTCRAVVWIQFPDTQWRPRLTGDEALLPSFFIVREKQAGIVAAQPELVADLASNPLSQLHLIALARRALNPTPFTLSQVARTTSDHDRTPLPLR